MYLCGTATGGTGTGGKSTGGATTGGVGTGGKSTGGATTGGATTGGTSTGGASGTGGSSSPSTGCNKARAVPDGSNAIMVDGVARSYVVRTPSNYDSTRPYRLLVSYHWIGVTAQQLADGGEASSSTPFYGLWDLSQGSTIFIAPNGSGQSWPNTSGQDVTFTDAVLAQVEAGLCRAGWPHASGPSSHNSSHRLRWPMFS